MKNLLLFTACFLSLNLYSQSTEKFHQFSAGINMLNAVFKNAEINTEFMLNSHIGITCDLGNQFSTSAGKNLNLRNNKIEGYYGKIGPRLYFAPHASKVTGYLSAGYIYSYFKQSASIDESDFYENFNITFSTQQKLNGTYVGIGTLVKMASGLSLDFGTAINFFSPKDIQFAQDYNNVTNGQPGYGIFIVRNNQSSAFGLGINCSIKYEFIKH